MRRLLVLGLFLLSACDLSASRSRGSSVTVTLPPPTEAQPAPGFSEAVVPAVR